MSFRRRETIRVLAWLALGAVTARAQYSTPVGTGAAKPKTLRATAVLEWTGALEKPSASRLLPVAVWDGEHYQPAGLYMARPDPLALETGTQYELERSGEPVGLFNVRGAAELHGEWIGMGRFQAEAPPPPPPKLKVSKKLPTLSNGKPDSAGSPGAAAGDDRPTLHRKTDDSPSGSGPASSSGSAGGDSGSAKGAGSPGSSPASSTAKTPATTTGSSTGASTDTGSSGASDAPTLHRRSDSSDTGAGAGAGTDSGASKAPDVDPDRPTLHRHETAAAPDADPDRPTLHRAHEGGDAVASIDPDRPHLRYGRPEEGVDAVVPTRLEGVPPAMQQIVAVSDSATGEVRPYQYHWAAPEDAAKMQAALAALAAQAVARPSPGTIKPGAQFGPAARTAARQLRPAHNPAPAPAPALVDERFAAYELSFSGGATLVYSAHTAAEGAQRLYVTLIAQPDFSGKPQILLQQVARGDRLDETPSMQLVDAVDTDNDQRAELIFQLNGATMAPVSEIADSGTAGSAAAMSAGAAAPALPEREFAIYRVANGKAVQVFNTGPLP
jgi:hypothetical protein